MLKLSVHRASMPEHSLQLPPMQTGVLPLHALPAIQAPPTQNSGVAPSLQRVAPIVQPQVPFVQTGVSPEQAPAARFSHWPAVLQNWGVAWLHRVGVPFGAHVPAQAFPTQA